MKTSLKISALLLLAAPTVASAQYDNQGQTPNQYYQQQMQQLQQQSQQRAYQQNINPPGQAGGSSYQQSQQFNVVPVYPGAGAPQNIPGNPNQY